jgi:hypothetical protein
MKIENKNNIKILLDLNYLFFYYRYIKNVFNYKKP